MKCRPAILLLVLLPILETLVSAEPQKAARKDSLPLAIDRVDVVDGQVSVLVRNIGVQTMTAWGVRATWTNANSTTGSGVVLVDGYESGYGLKQEDLALAIQATATGRLGQSFHEQKVTNLSVAPLLVVYEDGTAVGDEALLEMVFYARQLNRDVWRFAAVLVDRLLVESADPASAVAIAKRGLSTREATSLHGVGALARFRNQLLGSAGLGSVPGEDLTLRLRDIQDEVLARLAAADAHSRRRPR